MVNSKSGQELMALLAIYTRMRELVLGTLAALGLDTKQFGVHDLRSGGALV